MKAVTPPDLDCHAHVAPDVTSEQLRRLGNVLVLAMTRTLDEAEAVSRRDDPQLLWGCGVHPGVGSARNSFDATRLKSFLPRFSLVGEIGMDRRAGSIAQQERIFASILEVAAQHPVLISIHSAGCARRVLDVLRSRGHPGAILHWFLGTDAEVQEAVEIGCFFSVNVVMTDEQIRRVPLSRMLPETDYPSTRRRGGGARPGDVRRLAERIAAIHEIRLADVRYRWRRNLLTIATDSGALDRFPTAIADTLLSG